ncbi:pre-mRNA-splicing factor 38A [Monocercomonoides exilis]|uniref:pre-mRNA-splicing factor 38A n=1 Tax=Monocercomonoides exilis TaxID=2049356 RepID=UPI00355A0353|nr:pre-mRNA-splicing factor 38A [Monocercomonoides exilis]|eukprot:MONOS_11528.1-p1 / transcript=MONOS_11528.1 / gene=MONOS_11528 / organism=Monocercomonoides_exilis_PA203 / gene_product=pre-mRNA-splicing factor 38A / transcript_product=pre-mRNA-splicing factor 38A / location=Mono_scaffold00583:8089-9035(+) / protein_length=246 / sequence_SO=supercontig / SO=protein_coding / is_pseudo=false
MANKTDLRAKSIHGSNPQFLIEKITRSKIQGCLYWKEQCFALNESSIIDRARELTYYGGCFGGNMQPTPFLCLIMKMLQLQPEIRIVKQYIANQSLKYLRVLGAFYLRLVGDPIDIYTTLEPYYNDYRKLRKRTPTGWELDHVDSFIDDLLTKRIVCHITLPHLPKRIVLETSAQLKPRVSLLEMSSDLDLDDDDDDLNSSDDSDKEEKEKDEDNSDAKEKESDESDDSDNDDDIDESRKVMKQS